MLISQFDNTDITKTRKKNVYQKITNVWYKLQCKGLKYGQAGYKFVVRNIYFRAHSH